MTIYTLGTFATKGQLIVADVKQSSNSREVVKYNAKPGLWLSEAEIGPHDRNRSILCCQELTVMHRNYVARRKDIVYKHAANVRVDYTSGVIGVFDCEKYPNADSGGTNVVGSFRWLTSRMINSSSRDLKGKASSHPLGAMAFLADGEGLQRVDVGTWGGEIVAIKIPIVPFQSRKFPTAEEVSTAQPVTLCDPYSAVEQEISEDVS